MDTNSLVEDRTPASVERQATRGTLDRPLGLPFYSGWQTPLETGFLAVVVLVLLLPFSGKAFNMDDPLFVWTAGHILEHPADFYGFHLNWYGYEEPMHDVMKNPPLNAYFIALVAFFFGFGEVSLHLAFLAVTLAATMGTWSLARRLCDAPVPATLTGILTPAFLVSSNTVMCDVLMLAFWVWAVVFWLDGLNRDRPSLLLISAVLISLCALTKYFGISLVPLLLAWSWAEKRKLGRWIGFLLLPLAAVALYEFATGWLYGRGLFSDAMTYAAVASGVSPGLVAKAMLGLAFMGGGFLSTLFLAPWLWSWKTLAAAAVLAIAVFLILYGLPNTAIVPAKDSLAVPPSLVTLHVSVFAVMGAMVLAVATADLARSRDSTSLLLFLWVTGTFGFAAFLNWTTNIRSILPILPALGILLMRRIGSQTTMALVKKKKLLPIPLFASALLGLLTVWADASWANSARSAASEIARVYGGSKSPLLFQGHWGFQYYIQRLGAKPIRFDGPVDKGAIVAIPVTNTNADGFPRDTFDCIGIVERRPFHGLAMMSHLAGAGYYSRTWGPVPLVLGADVPDQYLVVRITQALE
jgi:4-amino-4-deoxy-L-arabinose transferase-like glycosyltransferase